MLQSACNFILEVSCHCFTLHVSAYMAIFRCVGCYYSHVLEGACFADFFCIMYVVTLCTWLRFCRFPYVFSCSIFSFYFAVPCVRVCLHFFSCYLSVWCLYYGRRSVYPDVRHPFRTHDQFFLLSWFIFRQLMMWGAFSDEKSDLYYWVEHISLIQYLRLLQSGHVPVFISPRNRVAKLYPRSLSLYIKFTYYCIMYL
jgi:hypothetical protein